MAGILDEANSTSIFLDGLRSPQSLALAIVPRLSPRSTSLSYCRPIPHARSRQPPSCGSGSRHSQDAPDIRSRSSDLRSMTAPCLERTDPSRLAYVEPCRDMQHLSSMSRQQLLAERGCDLLCGRLLCSSVVDRLGGGVFRDRRRRGLGGGHGGLRRRVP